MVLGLGIGVVLMVLGLGIGLLIFFFIVFSKFSYITSRSWDWFINIFS